MSKIVFDLSVCQPNGTAKFHGGGIYGYIVFAELVKKVPKRIIAYYNFQKFIDPYVLSLIKNKDIVIVDSSVIPIVDVVRNYEIDKIYSPLYSPLYNDLIRQGVEFIITIHGLRSLEMFTDIEEKNYAVNLKNKLKALIKLTPLANYVSKRYYRNYRMLFTAVNVHIVTVSQHTRYSIKSFFPKVNIDDIPVFYSPSTTIEKYDNFTHLADKKYYMMISADRWLKNTGRAISALDRIFDNNYDICDHVKVLGLKKNTEVYKRIRHKEKFLLLGYLSKEDLEYLYAGAYAFIYPTLNEGFGYPPLEAMKYGVPVITTAFSSIPEICGDAVLYSNPYSIEEIANRILQLEDEKLYSVLKEKSMERYNWILGKQIQDLDALIDYILC